jgi:hypothetical protein
VTTLQSIPAANPAFTVRDIGDETVIISEKGDMLHTLNEVGTAIWRNIDGKRSVQELLGLLLGEFDVPETKARGDILGFLKELESKEIIKWVLHP